MAKKNPVFVTVTMELPAPGKWEIETKENGKFIITGGEYGDTPRTTIVEGAKVYD